MEEPILPLGTGTLQKSRRTRDSKSCCAQKGHGKADGRHHPLRTSGGGGLGRGPKGQALVLQGPKLEEGPRSLF